MLLFSKSFLFALGCLVVKPLAITFGQTLFQSEQLVQVLSTSWGSTFPHTPLGPVLCQVGSCRHPAGASSVCDTDARPASIAPVKHRLREASRCGNHELPRPILSTPSHFMDGSTELTGSNAVCWWGNLCPPEQDDLMSSQTFHQKNSQIPVYTSFTFWDHVLWGSVHSESSSRNARIPVTAGRIW